MSQEDDILYQLNDRDEILFVNEAWNDFASANAGAHLTSAQVLGRPLWEFVADRTTALLYRDVLQRVRNGRPVRFAFRCDSPDCRRLLEMEVSGEPTGLANFRVRTLAVEARPSQPILDPNRSHSDRLLRMCGWCKKVDLGGRWVEVEEAVSALGLFEQPLLPDLSHGICEDCYARTVENLSEGETEAFSGS